MGLFMDMYATNKIDEKQLIKGGDINLYREKNSLSIIPHLLCSHALKLIVIPWDAEDEDDDSVAMWIVSDYAKGVKQYMNFFEYIKDKPPWVDFDLYEAFLTTLPALTKCRRKYLLWDFDEFVWVGEGDQKRGIQQGEQMVKHLKSTFAGKTAESIVNSNNINPVAWTVSWRKMLVDKYHGPEHVKFWLENGFVAERITKGRR